MTPAKNKTPRRQIIANLATRRKEDTNQSEQLSDIGTAPIHDIHWHMKQKPQIKQPGLMKSNQEPKPVMNPST